MTAEKTEIDYPIVQTKRPVSEGAEKWLGVPIKVLDHGFVYLVDYMGNDASIEQAARVSYGGGTRKVSETTGLIRYLRRHDHTTPFEMIEVKFHAKMPLFVARQWVRHRTANINEYSARYSILDEEFYLPEPGVLAAQSKSNKQGRGEVVPKEYAAQVRDLLIHDAQTAYGHYTDLLNDNGEGEPLNPDKPMLARELARMNLSLNFYTQWYWKIDLHNLMHFLRLRMDSHAQHEIRVYAEAMGKIIKDSFPIAWQAFEDYELNAKKFTGPELEILKLLFTGKKQVSAEDVIRLADGIGLTNRREKAEMIEKFVKAGIVKEA
ncbi:FAD-dependent thymidylate synthase [Patescibacteria group bacterium]|nr:FAD-dependent thymidylate synthase [Patescibacteria group bacterium]MCL5409478.1 FAD-dependent thymidylate synthase [Patescibacteria group bacterium]